MSSTMSTEHQRILQYYEQIAAKSGEMLLAARAADWDLLCEKEGESAALIAELKGMGDLPPMNEQERKLRVQCLKQILADDAEIRQLTEPWLHELEQLLQSSANQSRLGAAYQQ
jgi:flagellar protein FliT